MSKWSLLCLVATTQGITLTPHYRQKSPELMVTTRQDNSVAPKYGKSEWKPPGTYTSGNQALKTTDDAQCQFIVDAAAEYGVAWVFAHEMSCTDACTALEDTASFACDMEWLFWRNWDKSCISTALKAVANSDDDYQCLVTNKHEPKYGGMKDGDGLPGPAAGALRGGHRDGLPAIVHWDGVNNRFPGGYLGVKKLHQGGCGEGSSGSYDNSGGNPYADKADIESALLFHGYIAKPWHCRSFCMKNLELTGTGVYNDQSQLWVSAPLQSVGFFIFNQNTQFCKCFSGSPNGCSKPNCEQYSRATASASEIELCDPENESYEIVETPRESKISWAIQWCAKLAVNGAITADCQTLNAVYLGEGPDIDCEVDRTNQYGTVGWGCPLFLDYGFNHNGNNGVNNGNKGLWRSATVHKAVDDICEGMYEFGDAEQGEAVDTSKPPGSGALTVDKSKKDCHIRTDFRGDQCNANAGEKWRICPCRPYEN